jgi:hypothetical protein
VGRARESRISTACRLLMVIVIATPFVVATRGVCGC